MIVLITGALVETLTKYMFNVHSLLVVFKIKNTNKVKVNNWIKIN